jgi:hypothetical protein
VKLFALVGDLECHGQSFLVLQLCGVDVLLGHGVEILVHLNSLQAGIAIILTECCTCCSGNQSMTTFFIPRLVGLVEFSS